MAEPGIITTIKILEFDTVHLCQVQRNFIKQILSGDLDVKISVKLRKILRSYRLFPLLLFNYM